LTNSGTGRMPVEMSSTRGERFLKDDATGRALEYREARQVVTLGAGESAEVSIRPAFEPEQLVVAPTPGCSCSGGRRPWPGDRMWIVR
jgi:hypothetical protein